MRQLTTQATPQNYTKNGFEAMKPCIVMSKHRVRKGKAMNMHSLITGAALAATTFSAMADVVVLDFESVAHSEFLDDQFVGLGVDFGGTMQVLNSTLARSGGKEAFGPPFVAAPTRIDAVGAQFTSFGGWFRGDGPGDVLSIAAFDTLGAAIGSVSFSPPSSGLTHGFLEIDQSATAGQPFAYVEITITSVGYSMDDAQFELDRAADWRPTFALGFENPTIQANPQLTNTDIFAPGPFGGPPMLALDGGDVGLPETWAFDDVAHSMGARADVFYFSVNRKSLGLVNTEVRGQANFGQQEGDVYTSSRDGTNTLVVNQADWGMLPAISPAVPWGDAGDNIVSLDLIPEGTGLPTVGGADIVYNLDSNNTMGVSGADILAPGVGVIVGYADLGLSFNDEIDALHVDNGSIYFSLKRGSFSTVFLGFSGADVFLSSGNGSFSRWATAAQLGLQSIDDIDAIAFASDRAACLGDIADDFGTIGADGMVGFGDFLALLGLVGPCPGMTPGCVGDIADDFGTLGGDGQVSFGDFLALLGLVGPCP